MSRRTGPLLAATALCALPVLPAAAAKPVCHVITDERGDASYLGVVPGGATDDVLSADVASDGRTVTAVLRLADVAAPDLMAPLGRQYLLTFRVRGSKAPTQFLGVRTYVTGTRYVFGHVGTDATGSTRSVIDGTGRGTVDAEKNEVRVHAPATGFAPKGLVRKGVVLDQLFAYDYRFFGEGLIPSPEVAGVVVPLAGTGQLFDSAEGNRYVVGTPSCVRPGA